MLEAAVERILKLVPEDARVLDVGGWSSPFNRADHVLDLMPFQTRGAGGHHGPSWERFTARTWTQRDACDRRPWPFPDDHFDFVVCVGMLEVVRDPIWVCHELSRVARGGYVEVTTIEGELAQEGAGAEHRWLCEMSGGELVFTAKPQAVHHDSSLRVPGKGRGEMAPEDHVQGLFWEAALPARERYFTGPEREAVLSDLRRRVREGFEPTTVELRARQARDVAGQAVKLAKGPGRDAAARVIDGLRRR